MNSNVYVNLILGLVLVVFFFVINKVTRKTRKVNTTLTKKKLFKPNIRYYDPTLYDSVNQESVDLSPVVGTNGIVVGEFATSTPVDDKKIVLDKSALEHRNKTYNLFFT
jgi:hypothetical protein